jgi:hypothetical protein
MSWNVECRYAMLKLHQVKSPEELHSLLLDLASSILDEYRETENSPECLDDLICDIEQGEFSCDDEIITAIADVAALFLGEIKHGESGTDLLVVSEYDSDYDDTDFLEKLVSYLFTKSHDPYFLIRSAAFDKAGGYSHFWIGRHKDGAVVVEYLPDCLDALLQEPSAAVLA